MPIRLACLDMAGTTVRDGGIVLAAFGAGLAAAGIDPDSERHRALLQAARAEMGRSKIQVFRELLGDDTLAQRANTGFEQAVDARISSVEPLPGAADALERLRAEGVRVCLTTGFSADTRDAIVEHLGWRSRVDLALSPGRGCRGRPAPDMILTALMRLEIDAVSEVATAGDTASDLIAGTSAGCAVVAGVLSGAHDRDTLAAAPHTHLLDSVADLPGVIARVA